jgi:hypothetical protein
MRFSSLSRIAGFPGKMAPSLKLLTSGQLALPELPRLETRFGDFASADGIPDLNSV